MTVSFRHTLIGVLHVRDNKSYYIKPSVANNFSIYVYSIKDVHTSTCIIVSLTLVEHGPCPVF